MPTGDFAVAAKPGSTPADQSAKESYLHVDLSAVAAGATLNGLTLTLKEDTAAANINQTTAVIEAHLVTDFFPDGAAGAPYSQRPKYDTTGVKGARTTDGTWTFDLGSLVNGKTATELQGIALIPVPATPVDTYQVVWSGQGASAPKASYTASASSDNASATPGGFSSTPSDSFSSQPSTVTPSESFGSSGSFLATPSAPSVATPSSPSAPAVAAPAAAAPKAAAPATAPAAARARSHHGLPWTFVPGVLAVLVLLVGAAVALGQAGEPIPPREGSVVRRLERPVEEPA